MQGVSAAGVAASCSGSACNAYPAGIDEVILSGAYTPSGITWTQVSGNVYWSGNGSMTTQPNSAIYTVSGTTTPAHPGCNVLLIHVQPGLEPLLL